ncbi:MAG: hypothetical protein PHE72_14600 [candidate division Zixibacteria bacterium]|nr:hypothetical protein [candidate division Zixibacteria bacterium]
MTTEEANRLFNSIGIALRCPHQALDTDLGSIIQTVLLDTEDESPAIIEVTADTPRIRNAVTAAIASYLRTPLARLNIALAFDDLPRYLANDEEKCKCQPARPTSTAPARVPAIPTATKA